ncbi:MAG: tRNA (N6-threonylcarbamoyladenosine(37)-N6)-methyltransferase TrmO [Sandaracinaceae bacterium]|nr:tRNA (N6-threonylcarbamoyladenosine(37)-N6)-methyltransferase TrmO [Sandaracinaceae bacterium]
MTNVSEALASMPSLLVRAIGTVRSPFHELAETPRQPRAAEGARGRIELVTGMGLDDAIADLAGWDYVWVIFWFHRAAPHFKAKVLPPRSERKRGVLSTRAPHRPNPIGLSVVRLISVEGHVLHVEDLDLVDGTPVLDVKPYVPWTDAIPSARTGWLEPPDGHKPGGERPADPRPTWRVSFAPRADAQLAWMHTHGLGFDLRARIADALALGPQPHAYRRIKRDARGLRIAVKEWYARFEIASDAAGEHLLVTSIESGRRPEEREGLHLELGLAFCEAPSETR